MKENELTPFEAGVLAALGLIGKAIALNPYFTKEITEEIKQDMGRLMTSWPKEPKTDDGTPVIQVPMQFLLKGFEKGLNEPD